MVDGLVQNHYRMSQVPTKETREVIGKLRGHNGNRERLHLNGNLLQQFPDGSLLQQSLIGRRKLPQPNLCGEEKRPLLQSGNLQHQHRVLGDKVTTTMKKITPTSIRGDGTNQHQAL